MTMQQQRKLKENFYDTILVWNISKTDHSKGNLGQTKLQSLKIRRFIDNLFVFRYLYEAQYSRDAKKFFEMKAMQDQ